MRELSATDITDDLLAEGHRTYALYIDSSWRARRIETIRLSTSRQISRSVTLDVDTRMVERILPRTCLFEPKRMLVPLSILPKTLFLNFDVRNYADNAVALLTSENNSLISTAAVLACLERHGATRSQFTNRIIRTIYGLVSTLPRQCQADRLENDIARLETDFAARRNGHTESLGSLSLKELDSDGSAPADADVAQADADASSWQSWLAIPEVLAFLSVLALNFLPMVDLLLDGQVQVLKYRYVEHEVSGERPRWGERFGAWKRLRIDARAIRLSARTHTRIEAPPGLIIASAELFRSDRADGEDKKLGNYRSRIFPDRAAVYASDVPQGKYVIRVSLRLSPVGLLRQARYTVLAIGILLLFGSFAEYTDKRLDDNVEASVVLLVLLPTVLLALLWRDGEHDVLSQLLRRPRSWVSLVVALNVACGAVLAWSYSDLVVVIWLASGLYSIVTFLGLSYMSRISTVLIANQSAQPLWAGWHDIHPDERVTRRRRRSWLR